MALRTEYHSGGFMPAAPAQNRAAELDSVAGTFTRWNTAGAQIEQRPLTTDEQEVLAAQDVDQTALTNRGSIETKAQQALGANATFLALASPTNLQTLAQVKSLTRQMNALIRLELNDFADVSDT